MENIAIVISQLLQGPVLYVIASIQDKADMWNIFIQQLLITYLPSCVRAPKAAWLLLLISVIIYVLMFFIRKKEEKYYRRLINEADRIQVLREILDDPWQENTFLTRKKEEDYRQATNAVDRIRLLQEMLDDPWRENTLLEKRISDLQKAVEDVNNRMKALEQELRTEAEKALSGHSLLVPEIDNHFNEEEDEGNQMFVTEEYHKTEIDAAEGTQENQVHQVVKTGHVATKSVLNIQNNVPALQDPDEVMVDHGLHGLATAEAHGPVTTSDGAVFDEFQDCIEHSWSQGHQIMIACK